MKWNREVIRNLGLISQLGISMLTPIFMMTFLGVWIDKVFSTHFFLLFVILGIGGGFRSVYTLTMHSTKKQKPDCEKDIVTKTDAGGEDVRKD
ncbi:MAG: AtpZ/AtpI family protein [Lachnospiraceae bacterium]